MIVKLEPRNTGLGRLVGRTLTWEVEETRNGMAKLAEVDPEEFEQMDNVTAVTASDDGRYLAAASGRIVHIGRRLPSRKGFQEVGLIPLDQLARRLALIAESGQLLTLSEVRDANKNGAWKEILKRWDVTGYREAMVASPSRVDAFAFDPTIAIISTAAHRDGKYQIQTWPVKSGRGLQPAASLPTFEGDNYEDEGWMRGDPDPNRNYVLTRSGRTWGAWDLMRRREVGVTSGPAFTDSDRPILSADARMMVRRQWSDSRRATTLAVYTLADRIYRRKTTLTIKGDGKDLAVSPAGDYCLTTVGDLSARMYSLKTGQDITPAALKRLDVASFRIGSSGSLIAILEDQGEKSVSESPTHELLVWDVAHARALKTVRSGAWIATYAFSPSDRYIALGGGEDDEQGFAQIVDLRTGTVGLLKHPRPVASIAFSPDDAYIATGDVNGVVIVSAVGSQLPVAQLEHEGAISMLRFSGDGRYLAVSTGSQSEVGPTGVDNDQRGLHVWSLRWGDLLEEAGRRLSFFPEAR